MPPDELSDRDELLERLARRSVTPGGIPPDPDTDIIGNLMRQRDRYREALEQVVGLIETASSRARILRARDVARAALETEQNDERTD